MKFTADDLLGRTFLFHDGSTIRASVTIVAYDPRGGGSWRLDAGPGYTKTWISNLELRRLIGEEVLS
jgi:hypothetical protein